MAKVEVSIPVEALSELWLDGMFGSCPTCSQWRVASKVMTSRVHYPW